ncbi:MAG TPA: hypothetical protein PLS49_03925, partial [Candidatus Woesebacteria bacterium]|nr:hypothetical protein [Candidatus Woesebacteria bacterium]
PYNGGGHAKQNIDQQVQGYTYISNIASNNSQLIPGSIGISNSGTYGHIFYITEVYKDSNGNVTHYKAFECNFGASGYIRHDIKRALDDGYLAGWQKPN